MADHRTISADTLNTWLQLGHEVSILDIRPRKERAEWFIPQSIHFNAYEQLKSNAQNPFKGLHLAKDIPTVVVCAAGKTSATGAAELAKAGYDAYSLEGGMMQWTFAWNTAEEDFKTFKLIQVRRTAKGCLSYIIASQHEAAIVDSSLPVEVYEHLFKKSNLTLKFVIETHIHADHLSRSMALSERFKVPVLLPVPNKAGFPYTPYDENTDLSIGAVKIKIYGSPGHTLESKTLLVDDQVLLTGDTLFVDGVGRPDLKASEEEALIKARQLYQSLRGLCSLPNHLRIYPAHTSEPVDYDRVPISGSIGEIKKKISLLQLSEDEFAAAILQRVPPTPAN
jgi:glyoxylase-like metal-dependent hydrolase (beta-lactamase superfamily II)